MEDKNLKGQGQKLIDNLNLIKNKFIKDQEELRFSIRRDVVIVTLKDLLENNKDYSSLSQGIEKYIKELQSLDFSNNVND